MEWWLSSFIGIGIIGIIIMIPVILKFKKKEKQKDDMIYFQIDGKGLPKIPFRIMERLREERMMKNYPIGTKVITRSNEDEPYSIGKIVDYMPITQAESLVPVVDYETGPAMCLSIIRPYSKTLCNILDKLTPREQWNVLAEFNIRD